MAGQVIETNPFEAIEKRIEQMKVEDVSSSPTIEIPKFQSPEAPLYQQQVSQNAVQSKVKYDVIKIALPSEGKFYPVGHNCYGLQEIEVRNMTTSDEDILRTRNLVVTGKSVTRLLDKVILTPNIKSDDLLVGDRLAILVALRITAWGSEYKPYLKQTVICPSCDSEFIPKFDLSNLSVRKPKDSLVADESNCYRVHLPRSKKDVLVKFLTNKDESLIDDIVKARKKNQIGIDDGIDHTGTIRLQQQVVAVDGNFDRSFVNDFVETLNSFDVRVIRQFIYWNEPILDFNQSIECPECKIPFDLEVPITDELLYPSL